MLRETASVILSVATSADPGSPAAKRQASASSPAASAGGVDSASAHGADFRPLVGGERAVEAVAR